MTATRSSFADQEAVDALYARAMRIHGPRVLDLAYPSIRECDARVRRAIVEVASASGAGTTYAPYGGLTPLRRVIAGELRVLTGRHFEFRDVCVMPGAMAALRVAFETAFTAGGEVLVPTPCWFDYPLYLTRLGFQPRLVPLAADHHLDLDAIAVAISPRTCGIVLSQPASPSAVVYTRAELELLASVLARAPGRITWVSDESHRDFVWSGEPYASPAAVYNDTIIVFSLAKRLLLHGERIGYAAVSPAHVRGNELQADLVRAARAAGYATAGTILQRVVLDLPSYRPDLTMLREVQTDTRRGLVERGYEVIDAGATFFIYAKCRSGDSMAFCRNAAERGLLLMPSTVFHRDGYFRLSVLSPPERIESALAVLETLA